MLDLQVVEGWIIRLSILYNTKNLMNLLTLMTSCQMKTTTMKTVHWVNRNWKWAGSGISIQIGSQEIRIVQTEQLCWQVTTTSKKLVSRRFHRFSDIQAITKRTTATIFLNSTLISAKTTKNNFNWPCHSTATSTIKSRYFEIIITKIYKKHSHQNTSWGRKWPEICLIVQ